MKVHTTNYFDTFIEVADDTKASSGTTPPSKENKTVAEMQTIVMSNQINAALCAFFMIVAIVMVIASIRVIRKALASSIPTVNEAPAVYSETPMTANSIKGE